MCERSVTMVVRVMLQVQAYVTQDDILTGTLTVRETIRYSAQLQLPSSMSRTQKNEMVEQTIAEMGLRTCSDTKVGNWHLRGLSGGERRRLSIAVEVLTRPRLMYLDEPTSGLDRCVSCYDRSVNSQPRIIRAASIHGLWLISGVVQCGGVFRDVQAEELGERREDHRGVHPPAQQRGVQLLRHPVSVVGRAHYLLRACFESSGGAYSLNIWSELGF
jgi:hypothetical protein